MDCTTVMGWGKLLVGVHGMVNMMCSGTCTYALRDYFGYMPRGTNETLRHGVLSNANEGLSRFCMSLYAADS